jgi:Skp family chaperone for outer membrane proteins
MKIDKSIVSYIMKKDRFAITELMAEFQISYGSALKIICALKDSKNVEQIGDFDYRVCNSAGVKEFFEDYLNNTEKIVMNFDEILEEIEKKDKSKDEAQRKNQDNSEIFDDIDENEEEDVFEEKTSKEQELFETKCMDMIEKVMLSDKDITREGAINKSKEILDNFKMLGNEEMIEIFERVTQEFELASDIEFQILMHELHREDDKQDSNE